MISKLPDLLSCNPSKRVLPKFQFFLSKGASKSDIVNLVSKNPRVLSPSLKNHIVPTYEWVYRILKSHKETIALVILDPAFHGGNHVPSNIRLLIENGVSDSNIARLLRNWVQVFRTHDMLKLVEELKDLGFKPTQTTFAIALHAKTYVIENMWKEKVDAFKKWGWSDEDVVNAFKKQPYCMLVSIDKINLLMSFWVDQLGWDPLVLAKGPSLFLLSLEKRIIPRAEVVQFLLKKGLRKKNASLTCPFVVPEKLFLDMFINRFKESSYLSKLYQEKLNLPCTRDKTCMSWSKVF
ncbi:mTERF protein [Trifolium medium]|uniref:mTERF protein n=1 Tax=Trifolium medium TaxID=97028 RepID=A0A392N0S8_9FABA|nr:mTERF protein [Trifolium medium]